jgi:glyoxylase I family protein
MDVVLRLDHVAIGAENPDQMIKWYERVLGLVVHAETGPLEGAKHKTYLIWPPAAGGTSVGSGMMMEIMPRNDSPRQERTIRQPGLSHVAWAVTDFEGALAHLKKCEVRFLGEIGQAVGGGRIISFADCDGNMMQIVERKQPG